MVYFTQVVVIIWVQSDTTGRMRHHYYCKTVSTRYGVTEVALLDGCLFVYII